MLTAVLLFSVACSLDATILSANELTALLKEGNRTSPDFVQGDFVETASGYRIRAAFGEVSEKKSTPSGWKIEGVFY